MNSIKHIATLDDKIFKILGISPFEDNKVYVGETNIRHIEAKHKDDFDKYFLHISDIINKPDYVGLNVKDNSIELVKEFCVDNNYVKVAVRISNNRKLFARSLYTLNTNRVKNFIKKGTLKKFK